jgi:hypothetical protein
VRRSVRGSAARRTRADAVLREEKDRGMERERERVRWSSGSAGRRTVHAKFGVEQSPFDLCHTHRSPRSGALSTLSARHLRREQQEACREELSLPLSLPRPLVLSLSRHTRTLAIVCGTLVGCGAARTN